MPFVRVCAEADGRAEEDLYARMGRGTACVFPVFDLRATALFSAVCGGCYACLIPSSPLLKLVVCLVFLRCRPRILSFR